MTDLAKIAERNLRAYVSSIPFRNEVDREAALACVDVLVANPPPQAAGGEPVANISELAKCGDVVVRSFEALGRTDGIVAQLEAHRECERSLVELKSAIARFRGSANG